MKKLLTLCAGTVILGSLLTLAGCGEKPKDPIKENEGQGQEMEVPPRRTEGQSSQQGQ